MKIAVLGAGAWGTALAIAAAARGHRVSLWARDAAQAAEMRAARENSRYLPGAALPVAADAGDGHDGPGGLEVTADLDAALDGTATLEAGLVIVATPMSGLRALLGAVPPGRAVLWLSKGFEAGSGALGHEIARELRPGVPCGVLSGPSFAQEVALGQPTALVAASADAALAHAAVQALHGGSLRVYRSSDVIGVEVGGAVKNVLAIAVGALDGLALGLNARAALLTRGLAEITRLGVALGARPETFMGLSGLGDLVLTATGDLSRNRRVGLRLAAGLPLPAVLAELGHVAEGVLSAPMVVARARAAGVEMPICEAVVALLEGRLTVPEALARLMAREARAEG